MFELPRIEDTPTEIWLKMLVEQITLQLYQRDEEIEELKARISALENNP